MKKKKIDRDEVRSSCITIQVTPREKRDIEEEAASMGMTLSSFVRYVMKYERFKR